MTVEKFINLDTLCGTFFMRIVLPLAAVSGVCATNYLVFMVVPNEQVMGAVQRIFYFHVGSAMACYAMIAVLFVASGLYLHSQKVAWDALGEAAGAVAYLFCTIVLATGMIWGHSAWNVWWRWEPRLVSFLVLWLILSAYVVLRNFTGGHARQRSFAAVLGLLAAVNVPIVIYSIKLLDESQQLHPEVVAKQGLRDSSFVYTLIAANFSVIIASVWLMFVRLQQLLLANELEQVQRKGAGAA